jgi:hypothetical protein
MDHYLLHARGNIEKLTEAQAPECNALTGGGSWLNPRQVPGGERRHKHQQDAQYAALYRPYGLPQRFPDPFANTSLSHSRDERAPARAKRRATNVTEGECLERRLA